MSQLLSRSADIPVCRFADLQVCRARPRCQSCGTCRRPGRFGNPGSAAAQTLLSVVSPTFRSEPSTPGCPSNGKGDGPCNDLGLAGARPVGWLGSLANVALIQLVSFEPKALKRSCYLEGFQTCILSHGCRSALPVHGVDSRPDFGGVAHP